MNLSRKESAVKFLVCLVLLVAVIIGALAYLPPETTAKIGTKSAAVAIRGCKGAKRFVEEFQAKVAEEKKTEEPAPAPTPKPAE